MTAVAWAGTAAVAMRGLTGSRNVAASLRWLHGQSVTASHPLPDHALSQVRPYFVVLLPMLREQRLIADTVARFTRLAAQWSDSSLVLVTTQRERVERARAEQRAVALATDLANRAPTRRILGRYLGVLPRPRLERLVATYTGEPFTRCLSAVRTALADLVDTDVLAADLVEKARLEGVDARHHHCPESDAAMVHQINHAAEAEIGRLARAGVDLARIWLAVYNADSRPDPLTLPIAAAIISRLTAGTGAAPHILQQSALFTANLAALSNGVGGAILTGAALLQSRWTLAREIPRLRRQSAQARAGRYRWPTLAHCVGHGLFVRADLYSEHGGLPTGPMNEDLAFGYLACASGVPIDPLPVLEWADSPETVPGLVRQGRQWFWSYVEYPRLAAIAAQRGIGGRQRRGWLSAQGLGRGALWLGQSPATAAALCLPLLAGWRGLAATSAALSAYYVWPTLLIGREARRHGHQASIGAREITGGLAACLISSVGPWWCMASSLRRAIAGRTYPHDRTER